ncbi:8885_t:CDS:2 [Ambispora gerdemannii]|uniref:8885_t:CDS:1 n=1 Tax=Ambispora gerdemannii TaxID=144530 RepID=A0A9N9FP78_9GLOM|nr:8885_t:CDS:2 [Ambispora gerdemannii]
MPNYFNDTLDEVAATAAAAAASIVNHSDLTTVFDEWLANDLAGFISEGDEDKFSYFQTANTTATAGDDLSTSSDNLSPITSSTLTTPSANLGFDVQLSILLWIISRNLLSQILHSMNL